MGWYLDGRVSAVLGTHTHVQTADERILPKGTAYLTDIEPGTYTISNLVGSETGKTSILWACEKEVKAVDLALAMRRPFTLSNENDPKVKCEIVERPLPICEKTLKQISE